VDDAEYEVWGRAVIERAAQLIFEAIPDAQQPELTKTRRRILGRRGYVSLFVHFRHPDLPAQRAVWLYAVPAEHAYDFKPPHDRVGAGLMQDADNELSSSRFASSLQRSGSFTWKTHLDMRFEGWRLALKVDPAQDEPEDVAAKLAEDVLHSLARAGLIGGVE
jgi:hypothetical protein